MATQTKNEVRVLGIVGSPRRQGNTETLVDEVLRGAQEAGAQVEKIILNELKIAPCQACETCLETGKCTQQDDMAAVLIQMQRSQVWVLGTPVYWWGPSAQFKLFLDRWFGQEKIVTFKGRRVILTIPLGGEAEVARHVVGMFTDVVDYLEMELFAIILAPEILEPGKVRERPEILFAAYRAGQEAVSPQTN